MTNADIACYSDRAPVQRRTSFWLAGELTVYASTLLLQLECNYG
jgi:hypothetical protein